MDQEEQDLIKEDNWESFLIIAWVLFVVGLSIFLFVCAVGG